MPPSSKVSIAEALSIALDRREAALSKALPGTVVEYDVITRTCTVQPGVHRLVPSVDDPWGDEIEELPSIPNVPVMWPQGRGFAILPALGLLPGDPVLLICCDRDISGWLRTGLPSEPDDARSHSWGSTVAIPGLVHDAYVNTPTDAAALASKVRDELRALRTTLNDLITAFDTHTHPDPASGTTGPASTAETVAAAGSIPSVASATLKLDD